MKSKPGEQKNWKETLLAHYHQYRPVADAGLFILITYLAHILYWANISWFTSLPWFLSFQEFMKESLFQHSYGIVRHWYDITPSGTTMWFSNVGYIEINNSCSGVKQFYQILVLFLLFPGPWLKKLWYIPLSLVIMYGVNVFRILVLSFVLMNWPQHWDFSHDWILRPFFYVVIFILWIIWNERLRVAPSSPKETIS